MNPLASMRRLHERGPGCRGLAVDRDGVTLGPRVALVHRADHGYRCVPAGAVAALTRAVFGTDALLERLPAVLAHIARALEGDDLVKAQLLALTIPIGGLDDGQLARLAAVADLMKAGFDPDQPRDDHGRWTETGSAGSPGEGPRTGVEIADASEGLSDTGGVLPVADVPSGSAAQRNSIDMSEVTDPRKKSAKVLDDNGEEVLDPRGNPIWRPKDMPPSLFVDRGLAAAAAVRNSPSDVGINQMILDHIQFGHGGTLDAQRVNGTVVRQYVDYATVGIGLYGAAAGVPIEEMLATENDYARFRSGYTHGEEMDDRYRFLPKRNVINTKIGYELYNSGRVGPSRRQ